MGSRLLELLLDDCLVCWLPAAEVVVGCEIELPGIVLVWLCRQPLSQAGFGSRPFWLKPLLAQAAFGSRPFWLKTVLARSNKKSRRRFYLLLVLLDY